MGECVSKRNGRLFELLSSVLLWFVFCNNNMCSLCVCRSVRRKKPSCPCMTLPCYRPSSTGVATLRYVGLCAENPQLSSWAMPAFLAARKSASQSLTFLLHPMLHSGKTGCKTPTYLLMKGTSCGGSWHRTGHSGCQHKWLIWFP